MLGDDDAFDVPNSPEGLSEMKPSENREPSAAWRGTAVQCREFYVSLRETGFSGEESMDLVKVIIETAVRHGLGNDGA